MHFLKNKGRIGVRYNYVVFQLNFRINKVCTFQKGPFILSYLVVSVQWGDPFNKIADSDFSLILIFIDLRACPAVF